MMRLMNQLTDKMDWDTKVRMTSNILQLPTVLTYTQIFDDTIVAKWKAEVMSSPDIDITESMANWCFDELRYKSQQFKLTRAITVYDADIVKSDTAVPSSLQQALKAAAAPLEDVPHARHDWHPGSNDTVLNLVHPSLFPVVYGRTKILPDSAVSLDGCLEKCGEGVTLDVPSSNETHLVTVHETGWAAFINWEAMRDPYSRKFQWLPCEMEFEGDKVK
jgi:hypothetical protein